MNSSNRIIQMELIQKEGLELFKKKNTDYGDAFAKYGVIGVLVRIGDKISRLQSITAKQISLVNSESLRDTLIDFGEDQIDFQTSGSTRMQINNTGVDVQGDLSVAGDIVGPETNHLYIKSEQNIYAVLDTDSNNGSYFVVRGNGASSVFVIGEDGKVPTDKLIFLKSISNVIKLGMNIIDVECPEQM